MATIDHRVLLTGQVPDLPDPLEQAKTVMSLRTLAGQEETRRATAAAATEKAQRDAQQKATLSGLYKTALKPDGTIDQATLARGMADADMGDMIPDAQKKIADAGKVNVEMDGKMADNIHNGLKTLDASIASLAANPGTDERVVMAELGRLVSSGALNAVAQYSGKTPDDYAMQMVVNMPVGNPTALRQWLVQAGLRTADANKRLESMIPKYDEQDRGGTINQGTIDPLTGKRTANVDVTKTNSPGEMLSAATQRRGQNMSDARQREFNDIQRQAARTQIVTGADGSVQLVDKGTGLSRPAATIDGKPVMDPASQATKNAATYDRIKSIIPMAKELLNSGPTASGVGARADSAMNFIGVPTKAGNAAQSLEALSGWLVANVPRMEGPQSNFDLINYQTMAGKIGDRTLPVSTRMEALKTVESLMGKYSENPGTSPRRAAAPAKSAVPSLDDFFIKR